MSSMRYPAVPLVTVDPFFSIWSMTDTLYGDVTRHWTGRRNPMSAAVIVDGKFFYLMGEKMHNSDRQSFPSRLKVYIPQKSVRVTPTKTVYSFASEAVEVTLVFTSPLILNRYDLMTRPVSYIEYDVKVVDGEEHEVEFYFDISTECAVDTYDAKVKCEEAKHSVRFGKCGQVPLHKSGDSVSADWGYIHIADKSAKLFDSTKKCWDDLLPLDFDTEYLVFEKYPYLVLRKKELHGVITLAYDDIYSIEYFGNKLSGYYKNYFSDFDEMLKCSVDEYDEISRLCDEFDNMLMNDAMRFGEKYCDLLSLAYRQSVAAHKLVKSHEGKDLFLSKECHSNGCIGTLDCSYEGAPLYLKYNPDLVISMLRPIMEYASGEKWQYEFCPHDVGQYPLANGQAYGTADYTATGSMPTAEFQMPLEECGNILICTLAAKHFGADADDFITRYEKLLTQYADYLVKHGFDPEEQLCTDDFTGRFAHSCNLSLKSIMGIASYAILYGKSDYMNIAHEYAKRWEKESAGATGASRLAFDKPDSWSLKYNMVWDKIFGFNLFDSEIFEKEVNLYLQKMNKYGTPLDNRADFNVPIWYMWTAALTDNEDYRHRVIDALWQFYNDTVDRVPMSDWNKTSTNESMDFQNRSVIGGLYINLLV